MVRRKMSKKERAAAKAKGKLRSATVSCLKEDVVCMSLAGVELRKMVEQGIVDRNTMKRVAEKTDLRKRRGTQQKRWGRAAQKIKDSKALHRVAVFAGLPDPALQAVLDRMVHETRRSGDIVCQQGDAATKFYICVQGSCKITVRKPSLAAHLQKQPSAQCVQVPTCQILHFV